MERVMKRLAFLLGLALLLWLPGGTEAAGEVLVVRGEQGPEALTEALQAAADGDTIEVHGGVYPGPLVIERPVTLIGHDWPVLDGGGTGTVVQITAPDVQVSGFEVRNSGSSLDQENAGIAVEAPNAVIENNRLEETLFGIYLRKANGSQVRGNVVHNLDVELPRRGDGIRVWYSNDVVIENNVVERGRDVVLWYSERLTVRENVVRDGRYGLHFMYCDDALIEHNLLLDNSVGAFLMYSRRMTMVNNTVSGNRGPSGYGIGLKDMDDAVVEGNLFLDNRVGAYLDNSPREVDSTGRFSDNVFAYNDIGVNLLPLVRHNIFSGNSFVENGEQVAIAGGGLLQENVWEGNYWSDYAGYDAAGDGEGDLAYRSERLFENMMDRQPELRLFLHSPAANAVDFAARAFPQVRPQPKLADERPLMSPLMPQDVPALPQPAGNSGLWVATTLLLLALAIGALPQLRRVQYRGLGKRRLEIGGLAIGRLEIRTPDGRGEL